MNTTKSLTRSSTDKQVGGVAGGLARYFGLDTTLVRVGFIVTTLFTGGAAAVAYLAMLVVMPSDETVAHDHDPLPV